MIPSRGLRWSSQTIGIGRRRVEALSSRQFSSSTVHHGPIRGNLLLSNTSTSFLKTHPRSQFSKTSQLMRNGAGIRFASTAPTATIPAAVPTTNASTTPTPADAVGSSAASPAEYTTPLDSATEFTSDSLYNIPEHLGYLKSLGLDYGWGPTSAMEWILEHVHIFAGTPWWISIGLTAIVVRAVLFKPYIDAAENATRMATIKHITAPITTKMKAAQTAGDVDSVLKFRQELQLVHKRAGIKVWKSLVPAVQVFAGYGTFVLLRAMSKLPVPGLETGGALWFYNLTLPDPYFLLPVMTAGVLHWVLRRGGETGQTQLSPEVAKAMMYGFPALTLLFTWWLPAALQLSFFISGLLSFAQASLFRNNSFRRYFNMTPQPSPDTPSSPYKGTMRIASSVPSPAPSSGMPRSSPVLSTSELNSRFQASSSGSEARQSSVSKTQGLLKKLTKPISEVADSGRAMVAKGNKSMDARREKSEMEERRRYEAKRQEELKKKRWERENERRAERAARKSRNV